MRKMTILIVLLVLFGVAVSSKTSMQTAKTGNPNAELYFVDSGMLRLVKEEYKVGHISRQKAAEKVIKELIRGRDGNEKILRLIPDIKKGMTVKVKNNTATVNLTKEFIESHSDERQHEILTVFAIVNSLTSIDGIDNVKFTIEGKPEKRFKGFIDMRETFIPDYYI